MKKATLIAERRWPPGSVPDSKQSFSSTTKLSFLGTGISKKKSKKRKAGMLTMFHVVGHPTLGKGEVIRKGKKKGRDSKRCARSRNSVHHTVKDGRKHQSCFKSAVVIWWLSVRMTIKSMVPIFYSSVNALLPIQLKVACPIYFLSSKDGQ